MVTIPDESTGGSARPGARSRGRQARTCCAVVTGSEQVPPPARHRYRDGKAWTQRHWAGSGRSTSMQPHCPGRLRGVSVSRHGRSRARRSIRSAPRRGRQRSRARRQGRPLPGAARRRHSHRSDAVAEVGDLRRYAKASQFMSATGLVPSEHSSGTRRHQGAITKTGNAHLRRVLVEAAWHYRHRPGPSPRITCRRSDSRPPSSRIARRPMQGFIASIDG